MSLSSSRPTSGLRRRPAKGLEPARDDIRPQYRPGGTGAAMPLTSTAPRSLYSKRSQRAGSGRIEARPLHHAAAQRHRQSGAGRLRQARRPGIATDGALRSIGGFMPSPVAARSQTGSNGQTTLLIGGRETGLRSQAMPVCDKDHRPVRCPVAPTFGRSRAFRLPSSADSPAADARSWAVVVRDCPIGIGRRRVGSALKIRGLILMTALFVVTFGAVSSIPYSRTLYLVPRSLVSSTLLRNARSAKFPRARFLRT
jgi:hypothetical protein